MQTLILSQGATDVEPESLQYAPLVDCLDLLSQICRMALPSLAPSLFLSGNPFYICSTPPVETPAALIVAALQELLALTRKNEDMEQLIWNPVAAYDQLISVEDVYRFQEQLLDWNTRNGNLLPDLDTATNSGGPLGNEWQTYPFSPQVYPAVSRYTKLAAAHYNFYVARMKWALCILKDNPEVNEMSAYNVFYKAMRCAVTQPEEAIDDANLGDVHPAPEGLKTGFLPLLHIIGLCCPHQS